MAETIFKIQELIEQDVFLKTNMQLLKSIDGISDKLTWKMLAELKFENIT